MTKDEVFQQDSDLWIKNALNHLNDKCEDQPGWRFKIEMCQELPRKQAAIAPIQWGFKPFHILWSSYDNTMKI